MKYLQINEHNSLYEFDPNRNYRNAESIEEKMFCTFLEQYGWEKFKNQEYNSGKHHVYVILNKETIYPIWVGFLHALECDNVSKKSIQKLHFLKEELFGNKVM